jgi:hypothetical protein
VADLIATRRVEGRVIGKERFGGRGGHGRVRRDFTTA